MRGRYIKRKSDKAIKGTMKMRVRYVGRKSDDDSEDERR